MSKRNEKDLKEVPLEVKESLKFFFVETAAEVLSIALGIESNEGLLPNIGKEGPSQALNSL